MYLSVFYLGFAPHHHTPLEMGRSCGTDRPGKGAREGNGDSPPLRWTACGPVDPSLRTKTTAFAHARVRLNHCVSRGLPDSSLRARPSDPFRSYDHHPLALGFGGLYHASPPSARPAPPPPQRPPPATGRRSAGPASRCGGGGGAPGHPRHDISSAKNGSADFGGLKIDPTTPTSFPFLHQKVCRLFLGRY